MAAKSSNKVHTNIGHERALCGANPNRSAAPITVVSNAKFVATPHACRCGKCATIYKARGNAIDIPAKIKTPAPKKFYKRATAAYYRQQPDA